MQTYILKELTLSNSNFLEDLAISFDTKFTLIQSPNGSGKTSIFNAMRTGSWIYQGQTGHLKLLFRQNSLDSIHEGLIYLDEKSENLFQEIFYKKYYIAANFLNLLRKNISDVYGHLRKSFNVEEASDFSSILLQFSQMAAGEQIILQLCLVKTLREYIGISGAVILDGWPLSILDIGYRHLVIEILSSISEQVIIFEGNWWPDFPKQFDLTNLNLIQLHAKRPPAVT
jgi:ABC-type molybdenum transport system ATPase subunit/photorepair protein PhrA